MIVGVDSGSGGSGDSDRIRESKTARNGIASQLCRPYWRCYFPNTQAVIYVVDSTDVDRMGTSKDEFHAILQVGVAIKGIQSGG